MNNNKCTLICAEHGACPFSFTDASEHAQNLGCLPSPMDIVAMRVESGRTWACHDNKRKPCLGALNYLRKKGLPFKVVNPQIVTLNDEWHLLIPNSQNA